MPLLSDRVLESTTTTGTGTFSLGGALTGYRSFNSSFTNGDVVYYTADNGQGEWEVGYGTVGTGTLSRDTVLESSNANALVVFTAGTKRLFCTAPAVGIFNASTGGTISGPSVISTSSSSNALRITQTGSGNALVVEDSANPDSTPSVVDAAGNVIVGATIQYGTGTYTDPRFSVNQNSATQTGVSVNAWGSSGAVFPRISLSRSNGSIGTFTSLVSGSNAGEISFNGADGTAFIPAASISAAVDGTPGTNDMPGRLVFSTTADGASSPTEAMRIDSGQRVGIGVTPAAANKLTSGGTYPTSGNISRAILVNGTIPSGTTSQSVGFGTFLNTAASAFTLTSLQHFYASQGTIGAGSTVTNQFGYYADSTLTVATNNYGFYSNIAAGTGRWNFYAAGTAANYFAGNTTIAGTTTLNSSLNGLVKTTSGVVSSTTVTLSVKNRAGSTISVGLALS